jgi:hypothetical protein
MLAMARERKRLLQVMVKRAAEFIFYPDVGVAMLHGVELCNHTIADAEEICVILACEALAHQSWLYTALSRRIRKTRIMHFRLGRWAEDAQLFVADTVRALARIDDAWTRKKHADYACNLRLQPTVMCTLLAATRFHPVLPNELWGEHIFPCWYPERDFLQEGA